MMGILDFYGSVYMSKFMDYPLTLGTFYCMGIIPQDSSFIEMKLIENKLTILKCKTHGFQYIPNVGKPPPLSSSKVVITPKEILIPIKQLCPISPACGPQEPLICFLSLWIYLFLIFHINRIIQYGPFVSGFFHSAKCL